jgi:hypothetical protein
MIDVTSQLALAALSRADWSPNRAIDLARMISSGMKGCTDWDQDAGEEWIRVLVGARVLALISIVVPFGFILETPIGDQGFSSSGLNLVAVPDMDVRVLTSTREALMAAFGELAVASPALDGDCFSAEELWFVTAS